ncbi:MAG: hypothetical protein EU529_12945 [Promethearchaeota archaeon]|nr:MAG: hypothetical protein EU529_12945 [Candidatus Lokiarchaeota archaeon]
MSNSLYFLIVIIMFYFVYGTTIYYSYIGIRPYGRYMGSFNPWFIGIFYNFLYIILFYFTSDSIWIIIGILSFIGGILDIIHYLKYEHKSVYKNWNESEK